MILLVSNNVSVDIDSLHQEINEHFNEPLIVKTFRKNLSDFEPNQKIFVAATDEELSYWLPKVAKKELFIYIFPHSANPKAAKFFALDWKQILSAPSFSSYLTLINDNALFGKVAIGRKSWLKKRSIFGNLTLFALEVSYGDQEIKTAALMVEAANEKVYEKLPLFEEPHCDRSAAIIYAPTSIIDMIRFRYALWRHKTLPQGVGVIKSKTICFQTDQPLFVTGDVKEEPIQGKVCIKTIATKTKIATGWKECQPSQKESIRIDKLPKDEESISFYTKRSLPFLPVASEEAFAELFTKIRQNAKMSSSYFVLLLISVLMATLGLFQNSAPTIIGAMILAPLMGPLISLSMGVIRFEKLLFLTSFKTLLFSVLLALGLSALTTLIFPYQHITQQMAIRMHPTLLDLAVAILSGIAAAYGYANSKVGESLAGVAIAVALVPPLCVAGIGLGWSEFDMFWQAFLLFLANVIGIAFAAGVMFYLLGFASRRYVSAAFVLKFFMLFIIAFPLYISTKTMFAQESIYQKIAAINVPKTKIEIVRIAPDSVEVKIATDNEKRFMQAIQKIKSSVKNKKIIATFERIIE